MPDVTIKDMPSINEELRCVFPYATRCKEYPDDGTEGINGTVFAMTYKGTLVFIASAHQNPVKELGIPNTDGEMEYVEVDYFTPEVPDGLPEGERFDVAVIRPKVVPAKMGVVPFAFTGFVDLTKIDPKAPFAFMGVLSESVDIDHDAKRMNWRDYYGLGFFVGPMSAHRNFYTIDLQERPTCVQGLSGSPVFRAVYDADWEEGQPLDQSAWKPHFAGLTLRAGDVLNFVDGHAVHSALIQASDS